MIEKIFEPVLFLLWDPAEINRYSGDALERSKYTPRNLVGGSDKVSQQNMEEMIDTLREYTDKQIYEFPGDKNQVTGKADGIFLPCVVNSRYTKFFSDMQADALPELEKMYGENIEFVWYLATGGKVARVAKAEKLRKEQIIRRFDYWTKLGNFTCYYLEGGSGARRTFPFSLTYECYIICKERGKIFITGGGYRQFYQVKPLYENQINVVIGNALLYPEGVDEVRKMQEELFRVQEMPNWYYVLH